MDNNQLLQVGHGRHLGPADTQLPQKSNYEGNVQSRGHRTCHSVTGHILREGHWHGEMVSLLSPKHRTPKPFLSANTWTLDGKQAWPWLTFICSTSPKEEYGRNNRKVATPQQSALGQCKTPCSYCNLTFRAAFCYEGLGLGIPSKHI